MGTDNLFKKTRSKQGFLRKVGDRGKIKDRILIVCEGEKTEPNYFKSFPVSSADVKPIGIGANTLSLVKKAKQLMDSAEKDGEAYDQVWCVFDRDSHAQNHYNSAFTFAKKNNIKVAYTNESFELWYLLHFNYYNTALDRGSYQPMLDKLLGIKYTKNDKQMYERLIDRQEQAIKNAKKLMSCHQEPGPNCNLSTSVYMLVEELNRFI